MPEERPRRPPPKRQPPRGAGRRQPQRGRGTQPQRRERRLEREPKPELPRHRAARVAKGKGWGGVAKRGARSVVDPDRERRPDPVRSTPRPDDPDTWIEERAPRSRGRRTATQPTPAPSDRRDDRLPPEVGAEIRRVAGRNARYVLAQLGQASAAYANDRYEEARRILRPLANRIPDAAPVRELHGLTLYRLRKWSACIAELRAAHELTGSYDQHPVIADAYRALRRHNRVKELWEELRHAGAGVEVMTEGRLVTAGSLADRGDLHGAIRLLEQGPTAQRHPRPHHIRVWFALADLYERAGEIPKARDYFARVARHAPDHYDVIARLEALE